MSAVEVTPTPEFGSRRRRLVGQVALVLVCGLLLSLGYLFYDASRAARQQTLDDGGNLMRQSAVLLQPLLLADDRVSLNYLVNELGNRPGVRGIALYNLSGEQVARSGDSEGPLERELVLEREKQELGRLTFWLDPAPALQQRQALLYSTALLWLLTALVALLVLWLGLRPRPAVTAAPLNNAEPAEAEADTPEEAPAPAEEEEAFETDDEDEVPEEEAPAPAKSESGFDGLLELLRPVKERLMPRFEPSPPQAHEEPRFIDESIEIGDDEPPPPKYGPKANPLRGRDEEQLGLYSFEHELELILAPEDAVYLLLIDAASGHAEYVQGEERDTLLQGYLQQARQIAAIYNGDVEALDNGDIRIWFREPADEDRHGANALCAAKLFTLLYRAFNQSRIRQFQPVLSLHMALVRGNRDREQRVLEEAQFLTRTTQSNELISHTALTEAPELKANLLDEADVRREDEDKVLILSLSDGYEELLQKQASHLLSKS
ncbi:hypothetical protein [Marinobacterium aestuariivivens]|uniref:Guanylate cyclase domain-containing protein n=1 Tax=Marinobacterium aestuariivivens TaxID=1698799 RepID=A0ABW1ZYA0_9GAMM